jgi:lantibiotic modifying enzyme
MSARTLPHAALAVLAARAATPEERLAPPFVLEDPARHAAIITRRLERWARHAARGDLARLRETLAWRGVDLDRLAPALGAARLAEGAPLPDWAEDLAALLADALPRAGQRPFARPYEAILAPFAAAATARLSAGCRATLGAAALADLEQGLRLRLMRLCRPVLDTCFALFDREQAHRPGLGSIRTRFDSAMLAGPLPPFLSERPVLARLLVQACAHWRDAAQELAQRFTADRVALVARLLGGVDPGALAGVEIGDADLHDGHREVLILRFTDGARLVYKPRSLGLDAALGRLLAWLAARGLGSLPAMPAVLERQGYGWAAFVERRAATDAAALARHHRASGALVALAHALGATDLHCGNLIASGDGPVPIDLETVLSAPPRAGFVLAGPAEEEARRQRRSVAGTMLLTTWRGAEGAPPAELSGLWGELPGGANLPSDMPVGRLLAGAEAPLLEGFTDTYRLLLRHRDALLAPEGPVAGFAGQPVRLVLRDTATYLRLLRLSVQDEVLGDGADRAIALERLHHAAAAEAAPRTLLPMIDAERRALQGCDVPRFTVPADGVDLRNAAGMVAAAAMEVSPLDEARARIAALSEGDLQVQCELLRQARLARLAQPPEALPREPAAPGAASPGDFAAAARAIAERLIAAAHAGADGLPAWHGLLLQPQARRHAAGLVGDGLAEGRLGIAIFLAGLGRVLGDAAATERARRLLAWTAEVPAEPAAATRGHAAAEGFGSLALAAGLLGCIWPGDSLPPSLARRALAGLAVVRDPAPGSSGQAMAAAGLHAIGTAFPTMADPALADRFGATASRVPSAMPLEGLPAVDGYGRGTAGEADALIEAGALAPAAGLMARALARRSAWWLVAGQPEAALPGLQHGLAGIGHVLLRLAAPGALPALLPLRDGP